MEEEPLADVGDLPPTGTTVNDYLESKHLLPDRPPALTEGKYITLYAAALGGQVGNDQYVAIAPNGCCVVGLAPGHALIRAHHNPAAAGEAPPCTQQSPSQGGAPSGAEGPQGPGEQQEEEQSQAPEPAAASTAVKEGEEDAAGPAAGAGSGAPPDPAVATTSGQNPDGTAAAAAAGPPGPQQQQQDQPPEPSSKSNSQQQHTSPGGGGRGRGGKRKRGREGGESDIGPAVFDMRPQELSRVNFEIGKRDATMKQSGKKRAQGSFLDANSVLCKLESSSGARCV